MLRSTELYFGFHFDHGPILDYTQSIGFIGSNRHDLLTIKARSLTNISHIKFLAIHAVRMVQAYHLSTFLPDHIFSPLCTYIFYLLLLLLSVSSVDEKIVERHSI